jgi:hypothetical protein
MKQDGLEERLNSVKTANEIIEDSKFLWSIRRPPIQKNVGLLKVSLNKMMEDLGTLKELKLETQSMYLDDRIQEKIDDVKRERINYYQSMALIPKKLLEQVNGLDQRGDEPDQAAFFSEYIHPLIAMNDGATAIKMAEKFRNGSYTVDELNRFGENEALEMYGYVNRGKDIPNKQDTKIAGYVWSVLNVMAPIEEIDDKDILYHRIALGHPEASMELYSRRDDVASHIRKNRYTVKMGKHKMRVEQLDDGRWFFSLCYPELLSIEASPWLVSLLLNKGQNHTPTKEVTYIS